MLSQLRSKRKKSNADSTPPHVMHGYKSKHSPTLMLLSQLNKR